MLRYQRSISKPCYCSSRYWNPDDAALGAIMEIAVKNGAQELTETKDEWKKWGYYCKVTISRTIWLFINRKRRRH
jgi:hypothetical protein